MSDLDYYAPVSRTLTYNEPDVFSKESFNENLAEPYNVAEDYYTKIALRQWKMRPSKVAKEYFSVTNIKRIQKNLKHEIYTRSHGKFKVKEDQNVLDLIQVMIIIYSQYGKDLPTTIIRQVKTLNEHTLQYIAPDMMDNIKQYYGYLDDIKNPISPLPQPLNVNRAGRAQLQGTAQHYGV